MAKDLTSYKKHDEQYKVLVQKDIAPESVTKITRDQNLFKTLGFELALRITNPLPKTHIDIGTGSGWLPKITSQYFERVIGVEPSSAALEIAKKLNSDIYNVSFLNKDMIDALEELKVAEPVFVTTATVLNHIENYYVIDFLKKINDLPIGSVIFFDERYDVNIEKRLWHIRGKDWWIKHLPSYQLFFFNLDINNYPSGIYGINVGKENILKQKTNTGFQKMTWAISYFTTLISMVAKKLLGKS